MYNKIRTPLLCFFLILCPFTGVRAQIATGLSEQYDILIFDRGPIFLSPDSKAQAIDFLKNRKWVTLRETETGEIEVAEATVGIEKMQETVEGGLQEYYLDSGYDYLVILSGLESYRYGTQPLILEEERELSTADTYRFEWEGVPYSIHTDCDQDEGIYTPTNFSITLTDEQADVSQVLGVIPHLFYKLPAIRLIADVDGDGLPDFLLETGRTPTHRQFSLFLSSCADRHELVRLVATYDRYVTLE